MRLKAEKEPVLCETATVYGQSKYIGIHALASVVNQIEAAGAKCLGVGARIETPSYSYPSRIHAIEKRLREACEEQGITLLEVKGMQTPAAAYPTITVIGIAESVAERQKNYHPGQEIVLTKWTGMDGMLRITEEKEPELKERFAPAFLHQILFYRKEIFARKEIQLARKMGVVSIRQITDGGILAALWHLAKETETGLELDMKRLSILQETIEVCEHYRLNPYLMTSVGSLLMVAEDGRALAEALEETGIHASVIGRLTDNNDKMIHNGGEVRYIDRPAPDEILKLFQEQK